MRIQMHQEIEAIKFPALCASTVSFRFATGLVLSFDVRDCDDSSHMFDAFGRRFFHVISLPYLDCQCRVFAAGVERNCCCGVGESVLWQRDDK